MHADDLAEVLRSVRTFVRSAVVPLEERIDARTRSRRRSSRQCKSMGLYGFAIPEEYGGLGLSLPEEARLVVRARLDHAGAALAVRHQQRHRRPRADQGRHRRSRRSPGCRGSPRGEVTASFGLTEADAGSDPSGLATTATPRRRPTGCSTAPNASSPTPPSPTSSWSSPAPTPTPSATAASRRSWCRPGTPGALVGPKDHKMGQFGAWTADVHLDDVRVPAEALVGGDGRRRPRLPIAAKCLAHGRAHIAALCVGMAARLVHESVEYAQAREQGGSPSRRSSWYRV